jgi:uncharacterized protein involved in outer membrane biogenesis
MKRTYIFGFAGLVFLLVAVASWLLVIVPGIASKTIQDEMARRTGRAFIIDGGASLQFSPQLGIALHDVSLPGTSINSEPIVVAKTMVLPSSFFQLFSLQISKREIQLVEPVFTMQIDAAGQANIMGTQAADEVQIVVSPLRVRFENGVFKYLDEPNARRYTITGVEGLVDLNEQNEAKINAAMTVSGERTHISAILKSLPRAFGVGSPLEFNLDAAGASLSFGGRIVATQGMDLAGQLRVDTNDAVRFAKWLGSDFHGLNNNVPLALTAALESNAAKIQFSRSEIFISGMKAKGDISITQRSAKPNILMDLKFENLNTDLFLTSKQNVNWSEEPFDVHNFNEFELSYTLAATKMRVGGFEALDAQIAGSLKNGVMETTIRGPNLGEAKIYFDSRAAPTKMNVELALAISEANTFFQQFTSMNWFSGPMVLNGKIATVGDSQAAMIGAMDGQLEIKSNEAVFKGVSLSALSGKAAAQPIAGWGDGDTEAVSLSSRFVLSDGIATAQETSLVAPGVKITTTGDVDVLRKALNLRAQTKTAGRAVQISVEGPWGRPQISAKDIQ